jgi:hypothetical protein
VEIPEQRKERDTERKGAERMERANRKKKRVRMEWEKAAGQCGVCGISSESERTLRHACSPESDSAALRRALLPRARVE